MSDAALGREPATVPHHWPATERIGADLFNRFPPMTARLRDVTLAGLDSDIEALAPPARAILLVAALLDEGDVHEVLGAAGSLVHRPLTPRDLDQAARPGAFTTAGGRLRFVSEQLRAAVAAAASLSDVQAADLAIAAELARRGDWQRSAWHEACASSEPDEQLAATLEASSRESERLGDAIEALRHAERAARATPRDHGRARRLVLAGQKAYELGRPDVAESLLTSAERLRPGPAERGVIQALRFRFGARLTREGAQIPARCRDVDALIDAGHIDAALDALVGIAQSLALTEPKPHLRKAFHACLVRLTHEPAASDVHDDPRYIGCLSVADPERARQLAHGAQIPGRDADGLRLLGTAAFKLGELPRAADLYTAAAESLRHSGRLGMLTHVQSLLAAVTALLGDWGTADQAAQEALGLAEQTGQQLWVLRSRAARAMVRALRGDHAGALSDCEAIDQVAAAGQLLGPILSLSSLARGLVQLSEHRWSDAWVTLQRLHDTTSNSFDHDTAVRSLDFLAEAAAHTDHLDELRTVTQRYSTTVDGGEAGPGAPENSAILSLNLGYARALLSADDEAEAAFTRALASTPVQWPWLQARIELAYGIWLRRHRRVMDSRNHLESARRSFALLGAISWEAQAIAELRAAGVGSRASVSDPGRSIVHLEALLSPQELVICELVAQGLSNREIGERLRLAPRTIGSHLYRIFPKLSITSRAEIAALLGTRPA